MSAVWEESSTQARDMLNTVTGSLDEHLKNSKNQGETNSVIEGVRTIAINVIGSTGFGQHHSWTQAASKAKAPVGHRLTFMEAILAIVNSHIVAVFVPASILTLPFMPKGIQALGAATTEFPRYAKYLITKERDTPGRADAQRTLMGALVRVADDQKHQLASLPKRSVYLSDDEITGNLFNFTIAGFDTTASTMAYAIIALAIQPEWQDWIIEEIDRVSQNHPGRDYEASFPLLKRCLALMVRYSHPICLSPRADSAEIPVRDSPPLHSSSPHHALYHSSTDSPYLHPRRHDCLCRPRMYPRLVRTLQP